MLYHGCPSSKVSDLLIRLPFLSVGSGKECLCWMGALGTSRPVLCLAAPQLLWWHTGHRLVSGNELREKQEHTSGAVHRADFIHFLPPGSPVCPARPSHPGLAHIQALPLGRAINFPEAKEPAITPLSLCALISFSGAIRSPHWHLENIQS